MSSFFSRLKEPDKYQLQQLEIIEKFRSGAYKIGPELSGGFKSEAQRVDY